MICWEHKLKEGFGAKQFKLSNEAPTCLARAEAARADEYSWWKLQAQERTCVVCEEKRKEDFGKKQFKSSTPTCLACAEEARYIDYAIIIHGTDIAGVLSRCHAERTVELLIKHGKVSKGDILEFLQGETCFCIHCEDEGYFFAGVDKADIWWTGADWLMFHLEENHHVWELKSALIAQVVLKARASGSPPLTF